MSEPVRPAPSLRSRRPELERVIERYWSACLGEADLVADHVAGCFTDDARIESAALASPVIGHDEIIRHVVRIRRALAEATVRSSTDVQWSQRTARWCWRWSTTRGSVRGMDVACFARDEDRIAMLVVFPGLLPSSRTGPESPRPRQLIGHQRRSHAR